MKTHQLQHKLYKKREERFAPLFLTNYIFIEIKDILCLTEHITDLGIPCQPKINTIRITEFLISEDFLSFHHSGHIQNPVSFVATSVILHLSVSVCVE